MAGTFTTGGSVVDGVVSVTGYSDTHTTEQYALGTRRVQKADEVASGTGNSGVDRTKNFSLLIGDRHWVFIKASVAINKGDVVERDSGATFTGRPVDSNTVLKPKLLGVADNDIAANSFGWVITKGCAVVRTDSGGGGKSIAANALIDTDGGTGAGEVDTAAGTDLSVIGVTLEAASATLADFAQCYIDIS